MSTNKEDLFSFYTKTKSFINGDIFKYLNRRSLVMYFSDFNKNWGDYVNPFLIAKLTNVPIVSYKRIFDFKNREQLFGIGSILKPDLTNAVIWGSGFIKEPNQIRSLPNKILALRGKLTAEIFHKLNYETPRIYGDPALLYPLFFNVKKEKKYRLGIVPHYKDLESPILKKIENMGNGDIKIISPISEVEKFPNELNSCESILSSSLHGLILSDALGLPNRRFTISDKLIGGDFKFNDYYSGVEVTPPNKIDLLDNRYHNKEVLLDLPVTNDLKFDAKSLSDSLIQYINNR